MNKIENCIKCGQDWEYGSNLIPFMTIEVVPYIIENNRIGRMVSICASCIGELTMELEELLSKLPIHKQNNGKNICNVCGRHIRKIYLFRKVSPRTYMKKHKIQLCSQHSRWLEKYLVQHIKEYLPLFCGMKGYVGFCETIESYGHRASVG